MIVSTLPPSVGGVQRATLALAHGLEQRGVDIALLTRRLPGTARAELDSRIRIDRAGVPGKGKVAALCFALHSILLLVTRFRTYRIVHVQNIDTPLLIGLVARFLLGRVLIVTVHGEAKIAFKQGTWLGRLRLTLMRRGVHVFTALTPSMGEKLKEIGIPTSRIRSIPNGVDVTYYRPPTALERESARRLCAIPSSALVAVFVGRLVPLKNVDVLIKAWSRMSLGPSRLLLVGDGPDRSRLSNLVSELRLDDVQFLGYVADVRGILWTADVFVLLSEREGLSMAVLEAMATGLPVILSAVPGHESLVEDGHNGIIIQAPTVDRTRDQLVGLFEDPQRRNQLGMAARRTIQRSYTASRIVTLHLRLYEENRTSNHAFQPRPPQR